MVVNWTPALIYPHPKLPRERVSYCFVKDNVERESITEHLLFNPQSLRKDRLEGVPEGPWTQRKKALMSGPPRAARTGLES